MDGGAPCRPPHSHGCRTAPRGGQNFSVDDQCGARVAPVDPRTDELSFSGGEHSEVIAHQCGGAHGALSGGCERNSRYGLRGVKIGEASNPGPPKRCAERDTVVHARQRSRSQGCHTLVSSDEEPLVPCSRNSVTCTGSTVPASTGALLDAGVDESQFVRDVAARVDERSRDIDVHEEGKQLRQHVRSID